MYEMYRASYNPEFLEKIRAKRREQRRMERDRKLLEAEEERKKRREAERQEAEKLIIEARIREEIERDDRRRELQGYREELDRIELMNREAEIRRQMDSLLKLARKICSAHAVTMDGLKGKKKTQDLVLARSHFCFLARRMGRTFMQIGRFLNKDHTTAVHAAKRWPEIRHRMKT